MLKIESTTCVSGLKTILFIIASCLGLFAAVPEGWYLLGPFSDGLEQTPSPIKPAPRALLSPNNITRTPLRTPQQISVRRYLAAQHVRPGTSLRGLAAAASPLGAPQLPHDPLWCASR
jgi:hypothetical protein